MGNPTSEYGCPPKIPITYIVSSKIGFEFSSQNLQCCALSDAVGPHETKHLTGSWSRESVQFESVGGITMRDLRFQVGRQVDDRNSLERTPATKINRQKVGEAEKSTS